MNKYLRARRWLRRFLALVVFIFGNVSPASVITGAAVLLTGSLIHLWAIGALVRNVKITTGGPYRFIRHPFYLANFVIDLGICICGFNYTDIRSYLIIGGYLILFYLVYIRRMNQEEKSLTDAFGEAYKNYQRQVPQFLPCLGKSFPREQASEGFRWQRVISSGNEIPRLLRLFTYPLLFYLQPFIWMSFQNQSCPFLPLEIKIIASTIVLLQLIALILRLGRRRTA